MHITRPVAVLLAAAAWARADTTIVRWQVSPDNIHWSDTLAAHPGRQVWVQCTLSYSGTQSPLGLASVVFQPTVGNWDAAGGATDTLLLPPCEIRDFPPYRLCDVQDPSDPTQFGRVTPFLRIALTPSQALRGYVHTDGSGGAPAGSWLRIAKGGVTNWFGRPGNTGGSGGVPMSQLSDVGRTTADPAFSVVSTDTLVFKFGIVLSNDAASRVLTITTPVEGFGNVNASTGRGEVYWYASNTESLGSIRTPPVPVAAVINVASCGTADFNNDGDVGTDRDIEAFFACLAGNCCAACQSADFNNDQDVGTDADIEAFFRVLAGNAC